jgi:EAL domain-containing protein (putative c-di-GMP-specific phosphodiesterase class I)/GGDEF domain-containing protein
VTRDTPVTRFERYSAAVALLAVVALLPVVAAGWTMRGRPVTFVVLAGFVVAGELLPIRLPGKGAFSDELTLSAAFALAIVLMFGPAPGVAAYVVGCVTADALNRTEPAKALFNAAQSVLAMAVAAGTFAALTGSVSTADVGADLPAVLAAAAAFALADNLLTATGGAMLGAGGVRDYLRQNLSLFGWTEVSLLALVPVVAAAASASVWLVPLVFVPVVGIYAGARQGVANAYREQYDEVTGLPNRALLIERVSAAASEATGGATAAVLAVIAVDDLKPVLETLGPAARDTVARTAVARVTEALGDEGGVELARLAPEQLAVVGVPAVGGLDAFESRVGAAVAVAFAEPFQVGELPLELRAFLGFAAMPDHGESGDELLASALAAAGEARNEGVDSRRPPARREAPALDRLILAGQLRRGIERGELTLEYQPKRALAEGSADGAEALVRWRHPTLGPLSPGAFIPLAEETGLIREVTRWVLDAAVCQLAAWLADARSMRLAVNVSARDVADLAFPAYVEGLLEQHGVPPSSLQLEITETELLGDAPAAAEVLDRLARIGVSWAIDDFGTGYSSLAQLQRLPVDEIKIDRSFVAVMDRNPTDDAIVRSTIDLARALGLRVTAEGVETGSTLDRLTALGCDYAQGYFVGRPAAAEDLRPWPRAVRTVVPLRVTGSGSA